MRIKSRKSLWIVVGLLVVILLQWMLIIALGKDVRNASDELSKKSIESWSQVATSDADLAACQDAVQVALDAVRNPNVGPNNYTVESTAQDCLRR